MKKMAGAGSRRGSVGEGWLGDLYRVRVRWDDTDTTQRIYLGRYIKWLDDAVTEFLRARGMVFDPDGGLRLNGRRIRESFVVGEYGCRIERSSLLDDVIDVRVRVLERRPRVVVFGGDLRDGRGRCVARGTITYICVRGSAGRIRSAPIPPRVAARL